MEEEQRRGLALGAAAYGMWGLFPLYWTLLTPSTAIEVLAHRICWSLVTMIALVLLLRRRTQLVAILRDRRVTLLLTGGALVISLNWGGFIYGVNAGRVVEVSLGYFANPLVTVLLGVLVLGERLRPLQWAALGLAGVAVLVLTVDYGRPPWVALLLAGSFATYGLLKKKAGAGAVESLAFETAVLFPVALGYLVVLQLLGTATFGGHGTLHAVLLAGTGLVTAVPLICFGAAAIRVSLTAIGLLQYLAPTLQFALGVLVFREEMTPVKWAGFGLVWLALVIFTAESLRERRQLRLMARTVL